MRKEFLTHISSEFSFFISDLEELISSVIREVIHVLSFFFNQLLTAEPISSFAE